MTGGAGLNGHNVAHDSLSVLSFYISHLRSSAMRRLANLLREKFYAKKQ